MTSDLQPCSRYSNSHLCMLLDGDAGGHSVPMADKWNSPDSTIVTQPTETCRADNTRETTATPPGSTPHILHQLVYIFQPAMAASWQMCGGGSIFVLLLTTHFRPVKSAYEPSG